MFRDGRKSKAKVADPTGIHSVESRRKLSGRQQFVYFVRILYCAEVSGTTESRPCRTSGESSNSESAFISAKETRRLTGGPALIVITGFLGSSLFTDTTVAVP